MFIPYRVDVPFNHRPVVNWALVAGVILVFCIQIPDLRAYSSESGTIKVDPNSESGFVYQAPELSGITRRWLLDGWGIKGLFGHMWLHGGVLHLVGNLIFLWLFGNAVCSKIGNAIYLPIYVLCGLVAAFSHLLFFDVPMLGASGAINGMVGMYLVFFPENSISCFFLFYIRPYWFTVRSFWMILLWFIFDIWGAFSGGGGVAYFAHIGGFASGFALAVVLLKTKMITMERDEKSLLELVGLEKDNGSAAPEHRGDLAYWQQRWDEPGAEQAVANPETHSNDVTGVQVPLKSLEDFVADAPTKVPRFIRFTCRCGQNVKISGEYAGLTGRCPNCSARLKIPSGRENSG